MRESGLLDCFELLHFHLGSQISNIRTSRTRCARRAASTSSWRRLGAPLQVPRRRRRPGRRLRRLADQLPLVDELHHRGVRQRHRLRACMEACDARGRAAPDIVSESGRAIVAHHAVLVVDVLGHQRVRRAAASRSTLPDDAAPVVQNLLGDLPRRHAQELARGLPRRARVQGGVPHALHPRPPRRSSSACSAENIFWAHLPEDPAHRARAGRDARGARGAREGSSSDTYFCNFSVFQSLPDSGRSTSSSRSCRSTG